MGDPASLRHLADQWREQSAAADTIWPATDRVRTAVKKAWQAPPAHDFDHQAEVFGGEVSATATSLRFAADGLLLAASTIDKTRQAADAICVDYAKKLQHMYVAVLALAGPTRTAAMSKFISDGTSLGQHALQAVYEQMRQLDTFLATMPRRFELGKSAPWRQIMSTVNDARDTSSFSAAVTIASVRTTRREGVTVAQRQDGQVMVAFDDYYAMGLHGSLGAKVSIGSLPKQVQDMLQRAYGEGEAAPLLNYQQRYIFKNQAEADAFLARLNGKNLVEKAGSFVRNVAGFVTGPIADFGPWHDQLTGRPPDERTFQLGGMIKASGDVGAFPVVGGMATAQGDLGVTLTVRPDGSSSWQTQNTAAGRLGGTVLDASGNVGGGVGAVSRVDYDAHGHPTRYLLQQVHDVDPTYNAGTNNTSVGVHDFGKPPAGQQPRGLSEHVQLKADDETLRRTVVTSHLDLAQPANRAAFEAAKGIGDPVPTATGTLGDRVLHHGITTTEQVVVNRGSAEISAKAGLGITFAAKVGPQHESATLLDGRYIDASRSDHLYDNNPSASRPIPRDPLNSDQRAAEPSYYLGI